MLRNKKSLVKVVLMGLLTSTNVIWGGTVGHAEEPNQAFTLDPMVVTATRTPIESFKTNANVNVITKEQIERQHYESLQDALRDVPGVQILDYGRSGYEMSSALRINGSESVVVLIDGVRVNQANVATFPATVFSALDNVEKIEVLKGTASTLYGSDAKGGVINIITRKIDGQHTKFSAAVGTASREQYKFLNEGRNDRWGYNVYANKQIMGNLKDGDGKTIPQSLNAETFGFKITNDISKKANITLSYDAYKSDFMYLDNFYGGGIFKGKHDTSDWTIRYEHEIDKTSNNQFVIKRFERDVDRRGEFGSIYKNNVKSIIISDQYTKQIGDNNTIVFGGEYNTHDVYYNTGSSAASSESLNSKALYLQDSWNITDALLLTSGIRYDNHSLAGDKWTPKFNLGYTFSDRTNAYISYGKFFVTPVYYNYFGTYANPNIKPETGDTIELGINHKFDDNFNFTAHVYKTETDNKIGYDSSIKKYVNIAKEKLTGWDMQLTKTFTKEFNMFVGYTHLNVEQTQDGITTYMNGGYLPKDSINIGVNYTNEKLDVGLVGRGIFGKGEDKPDYMFPCKNYWVVDLGINYKVNKNIKTFVKVNNLFDKLYSEQSGSSAVEPTRWYTREGRNFLVGMEYNF